MATPNDGVAVYGKDDEAQILLGKFSNSQDQLFATLGCLRYLYLKHDLFRITILFDHVFGASLHLLLTYCCYSYTCKCRVLLNVFIKVIVVVNK